MVTLKNLGLTQADIARILQGEKEALNAELNWFLKLVREVETPSIGRKTTKK